MLFCSSRIFRGSPEGNKRMSHPLVLVVDDMADVRELVRRTLTPSGYQVCECADGAAAIAMARHMRPAVILLDLGLPGLDGWEVASIIHTDPVSAATPIIGLTGWSS